MAAKSYDEHMNANDEIMRMNDPPEVQNGCMLLIFAAVDNPSAICFNLCLNLRRDAIKIVIKRFNFQLANLNIKLCRDGKMKKYGMCVGGYIFSGKRARLFIASKYYTIIPSSLLKGLCLYEVE